MPWTFCAVDADISAPWTFLCGRHFRCRRTWKWLPPFSNISSLLHVFSGDKHPYAVDMRLGACDSARLLYISTVHVLYIHESIDSERVTLHAYCTYLQCTFSIYMSQSTRSVWLCTSAVHIYSRRSLYMWVRDKQISVCLSIWSFTYSTAIDSERVTLHVYCTYLQYTFSIYVTHISLHIDI